MHVRVTDAEKYLEELKACVLEERDFDIQSLSIRYSYLGGMRDMHAMNLKLLKRQLIG